MVEPTIATNQPPAAAGPASAPPPEPAAAPHVDRPDTESQELKTASPQVPEPPALATAPPANDAPLPARPTTSRSRPEAEDVALWGFDPAAREAPDSDTASEPLPATAAEPPGSGPAIAVEASAVVTSAAPAMAGTGIPGLRPRPNHGWSVRLSPKAAGEQERRLKQRQAELPALVAEIVDQVHQQRRAVSDRGSSRQAVRSAAEQTAPPDLPSAHAALGACLEENRLAEAAAIALRAAEAFPGEVSAELACRAGEACRQAKDGDLAVLCFTTAVLAAPPCEAACWQLAGMALEQRDARLGPMWMEFLARLLRVRGADEDAIAVYRQLLNLAPRRQDVRDVLRVASLTGTLPD